MTIKRAIELIQIEKSYINGHCDRNCGKCDIAQDVDDLSSVYDITIQALEKQIPKNPVKGELYYWVDSVKMQGRYHDVRKKAYQTICPMCSHAVLTGTNFCIDCGQKLDWSDVI